MPLSIKKSKDRFCCPAFLNYVRSQPCCVCGKPATASHMKSVKFADGSDALAVPACMPEHHVASTKTSREILKKAGIKLPVLHLKLWTGFLRSLGRGFVIGFSQEQFEAACGSLGLREKAPTKRKNRVAGLPRPKILALIY
jgi:deoxycytidylate deaminase